MGKSRMSSLGATMFSSVARTSLLAGCLTGAHALVKDNNPLCISGQTYYVSSTTGDDANDGKSEAKAWKTLHKVNRIVKDLKPGDRILLERGSRFESQALHLKDVSGVRGNPIRVDAYGVESKPRPLIAANGAQVSRWHQDYKAKIGGNPHKGKGDVSSAVLLKDASYITVANLEITNDDSRVKDPVVSWKWTDSADSDGTKLDRSIDRMDRTGIAGIAENGTTMSHVTVEHCFIHDVDGNIYNKHMANGGIYFMAHLPKQRKSVADDVFLQEHVSRFDSITIRNNHVQDVDRWGIAVGYTAYLNFIDKAKNWNNDFNYGDGRIDDALIKKYGATNVLIENNYVYGAGGDAITVMYCDRPLVQGNVAWKGSKHINTQDYTATSDGRVAAGIWPWRCKNAVFQYNEAYETLNADHGNGDGQPWDADFGDGTLYQYNYSAGNSFATLMICNEKAVNTTFRYNIAYGDNGALDLPSSGSNNHVYNNTFIMPAGANVFTARTNTPARVENNIFVSRDDMPKREDWSRGGSQFNHNVYVNYVNKPASDVYAVQVNDPSKVLVNLKSSPRVPQASGKAYARGESSPFHGFRLVNDSPVINVGVFVRDSNGFKLEHDFFKKKIVAMPDLGAVESNVQ